MTSKILYLGALILSAALAISIFHATGVHALSGADWNAGNIIDDATFTNKDSMSVADIQNFLNKEVGTGAYGRVAGQCDTEGQAQSELGGGTRAQYGAAHGTPAPFTCLKDYYEVPKTTPGPGMPANNYGGLPIPAGAESAAQLIWNAAQQYNISPKVLLVKLHTESAGPLTTDDWPTLSQYKYAMGAHCPDSGPNGSANCDTDYAGFSIQISEAAALMRYYLDNMGQTWWQYKKPYTINSILWNVEETGCGAGNVYIETSATAALYTYTPYQPNQAALDNLYGTGDGCSAYGNRNFWRVFNSFFGSTHAVPGSCDTTVPNVVCVWELKAQDGDYFYTTSITERDASILNGYSYMRLAFYARPHNQGAYTSSIPTYRLQKSGDHYFTNNQQVYQQYLNSGWVSEGIAWYTDPTYSNTGNPEYKIRGPDNRTLFVRYNEYANYIARGYVSESEVMIAPTKLVETAPTKDASHINVYRILGCNNSYMFTTSIPELESILSASCAHYEGVAYYASSDSTNGAVPVNRFNNNGRHIWTTSQAETVALTNAGWSYEGVAYYASSDSTNGAVPVNRFNNNGRHIWTTSQAETVALTNAGWSYEGVAYYASSDSTNGAVPVNRFNNNGRHIWTTSQAETVALTNAGWSYEGVAYYASSDSTNGAVPVNRFNNNGRHIWTTSQAETVALTNAGWSYEGVAYYASSDSTNGAVPVNRFNNNGRHIWTTSQAETVALTNAGWSYEGVAYYVNP